ncbi:MAG: hypothetical protein HKN16_04260, partial [Saprospiraceae bacterium]|nr:hypothetical protein [Saprospiraceae bacterium]
MSWGENLNGPIRTLTLLFVLNTFFTTLYGQSYQDCILNSTYVGGRVYLDYNDNKSWESSGNYEENGAPGITVHAYDMAGTLIGTTQSDASGGWAINVGNGVNVRLEFVEPAHFEAAKAGISSKSNVAFATAPSCNVDFGVHDPLEFCETNPEITTICNVKHFANDNVEQIVSLDYLDGGNSTTDINDYFELNHPVMVSKGQTGNLWGLAFGRKNQILYSSATYKNMADVSSDGMGAIYCVDNSTNDGTSGCIDSAALLTVLNAGADPTLGNMSDAVSGGSAFDAGFDGTGKIGLGGIDLNEAGDTLWAVNLFSRKLVGVPLSADGKSVAGAIQEVDMPSPATCTGDEIRPWALKWYRGKLYVGMVCSGEVTQSKDTLRAYVYTYTPGALGMSSEAVLSYKLNFDREGSVWNVSGDWNPWKTTWNAANPIPSAYLNVANQGAYPCPILSDIAFDRGDMILGFLDRFGDQFQFEKDPAGVLNPGGDIYMVPAGDIQKAGLNADGETWTIENNGSISSSANDNYSSMSVASNAGPGGKEFYFGDRYSQHEENTLGGLANLPGRHELVVGAYDPTTIYYEATSDGRWGSGGLTWHDNK